MFKEIIEENEFLNKKIIVTGASSGIGQSVALYFLNCGAQVILAGQDIHTMESLIKNYSFTNATIMKFDLARDIHIFDFKSSVVERFKKIDIIVNCAGIKLDGDVEKTFPEDFDYTLDINLRAVFAITKFLAGFMDQDSSIINLSCLYGTRPICGMISYAISKAGLEGFTRYAAAEFAPAGIRVNAVTACPVDTNSFRYVNVSEDEIKSFNKRMENNIPLGRIARPDDIVKAVIFLASRRSSKITGQIIKVDGGRSLTSSGYVHYKGIRNMNFRFEPDAPKFMTWLHDLTSMFTNPKSSPEPKDEKSLKKYIQEKINESNFSTNTLDAHSNIKPNYKIVDVNDTKLKDKFLEGKTPNPLYEKKEREQEKIKKTTGGKTSYNYDIPGRYTGQLMNSNFQPIQENYSIHNTYNDNMNNMNVINTTNKEYLNKGQQQIDSFPNQYQDFNNKEYQFGMDKGYY